MVSVVLEQPTVITLTKMLNFGPKIATPEITERALMVLSVAIRDRKWYWEAHVAFYMVVLHT